MPSAVLLAPVVMPLAAAAAVTALGAARLDTGRVLPAAGAWASAAALAAVWIPLRSTQELALGSLGYGSSFDLRIDAVAFAFEAMIILPAAVMLTLQPRTWQESSISLLALAAALAAVEAGGVVVTAIAGGTAATLALVLLQTQDPLAPRPSWAALLAGWLALAWVGVLLQVRGGTAVYQAVPVSSVTPPVFALACGAAVLVSGLFPWRGWPVRLWARPSLAAAGVCIVTLYPLGFYLLVRAYEMGNGRYPHIAFNLVLALLGAVLALTAAYRAQAAATRRDFFAEVVPASGGAALTAVAIGNPLGLAAGVLVLTTLAVVVAALVLLPDEVGAAALVVVAACAGLPPGIAFGARVLGLEATFEGGDFVGLIGLLGMAGWALWVVASARAAGLPAGSPRPARETFPRIAGALGVVSMAAGPALALIAYGFADPVAAAVIQPPTVSLGTRFSAVITSSTVLPALTLFLPLFLVGALAYPGIGAGRVLAAETRPAVLTMPRAAWWIYARELAAAARIPEQYRSIVDVRALERAASGGRPLLWLTALAALAFAVTR